MTFAPDGLARSVKFFPFVGLVIGSGAALLEKVLEDVKPTPEALAILTLHVTAVPFGAPLALASALAVSVAVNCVIFFLRRAGHAARTTALNSAASPGA